MSDSYSNRINQVMDYVNTHLSDTLDLQTLAEVAHFSPSHIHRVFMAHTGESLAGFVRRKRLERAARRLIDAPHEPVLSIALDSGFRSAEVFSRVFKSMFDVTPSAWRQGNWRGLASQRAEQLSKIHQVLYRKDQALDSNHQEAKDPFAYYGFTRGALGAANLLRSETKMDVVLKAFPDQRVAYMRYTGPYGSPKIGEMWMELFKWAGAHQLLNPHAQVFGVGHDDPLVTAPEQCRYDCCIVVAEDMVLKSPVSVTKLQGGQYACTPYRGTSEGIFQAWMQFIRHWLPTSGFQPADQPMRELYQIPLATDKAEGEFACELCMPVRPL